MKKIKQIDRSQEAQNFVDQFGYVYNKKDGQIYHYCEAEGIYRSTDTVETKHLIDRYLLAGQSDFEWDSGTFAFFLEHVTTKARCVDELGAKPGIVVFKNGTFHLRDMTLRPHSKENLAITALPFNYDPKADCPVFKKYVHDVSNGNVNTEKTIGEVCGAVLIHSTRPQRAILSVGAGDNGKSVFLKVAKMLCGEEVTAEVSLGDLVSNRSFDRVTLLNSNLAVIHELEQGLKLEKLLSENPKRIVTCENIAAEIKFGKKIFFKPKMTLLCASNYMPIIEKPSPSLMRRLLIIRFTKIFTEEEKNQHLTDLIRDEMSGVVNYALSGYQRLRKQNYIYSLQKESDEYYLQKSREFAPYHAFVQENIVICPGHELRNDDFITAYKMWANKNDIDVEDNLDSLAKHLSGALHDSNIPFGIGKSGGRRYKSGIKLVNKREGLGDESI